MKRIILPLITLLSFYSDSIFAEFFPELSFLGDRIAVPRFLLVVLTLMGIYYIRNVTLIYAGILGLMYDVYYTGIIGAYLFLLPISVYIASKIMKMIQNNLFTAGLVVLVNVSLVEFLIYGLNYLLFEVNVTIPQFMDIRLWPTLLLNLIFFLIIVIPFSRWLQKRKKELASD